MTEGPIILFDGVCNFCNGAVNFVIKQDKKKVFRFAALQSESGQVLLKKHGFSTTDLSSFVLIENGKAYKKTTAALRVANYFSPLWRWTNVFWILPAPVRDVVYNIIAKYRYRWFGQKEECMIPSPELRKRFLQ